MWQQMSRPGLGPALRQGPKIAIGPRPALRLTVGLRQSIALMALSGADLLAWASVAAADNPAIRIRLPAGAKVQRLVLEAEGLAAPPDSLIAHLLAQISRLPLSPRARAIALVLTEELDPTGWLAVSPTRLVQICGADRDEIDAVIAQLQRLEPAGVFARTLAECLSLQAAAEGDLSPAMQAVLAQLPLLARGAFAAIAQLSGIAEPEIRSAAGRLRGFDPKPGLAFTGFIPPAAPPDFVLHRGQKGWAAAPDPQAPRVEIEADSASNRGLATALERRATTAQMICNLLATRQSAWLEGGAQLPLTTRDIAGALQLHVSTVNRVLSAMVLRGPRGTLPLRALLAAPIQPEGPASTVVRARLAELLAQPETTGWSDRRLAEALTAEGLPVARRTVAKYRAGLAAS